MSIVVIIIAVLALAVGFTAFTGAPYVPSRRRDIRRAFDDLYAIGRDDVLLDIGSGDGVVLREASRRGARAVGYEINPLLVGISRFLSRGDEQVSVRVANFWSADFPDDTTIIYTFGDSRDIDKMAAKVQQQANRLGRPLYFMSYAFTLKEHAVMRTSGAYFLYIISPLQGDQA